MEEVSKEFYVYGCYVDGVLKYIGKVREIDTPTALLELQRVHI